MKDYHVIIFLGRLPSLTYFMERFIDFAKLHKIDYYAVDVNKEETYNSKYFDLYAEQENVIMVTFNNIGVRLMASDGSNLWKKNNIPVFDCIVDHPRNFDDIMLKPECDLYVFSLDEDHVEYIKRYYKKIKGVFFSPNGGNEVNSSIPFRKRKMDVIYMGECQKKIGAYPVLHQFSDGGQKFFSGCISNLANQPMKATETIIEQYCKDNAEYISEETLFELKSNYSGFIEATVRRFYKLEGMKALSDAGVHVDVFGTESWLDEDYPYSDNIVLHGRIPVNEMMDEIGNAKISLCFIPWFKKGCSEKNFDSMLNAAVCVTDRSDYLNEHYMDGKNIVYFDLNNPRQMANDVKWLLDHPDEAEKIARNGYNTAKKYDTWMNRFEYIWSVITQSV